MNIIIKSDMNIKKMRELISEKLNINLKDVILSDKKDGKPLINDKSDSKQLTSVIKGKSANQFLISNAKCEIDTSQLDKALECSRASTMTVDDTQAMIDQEKLQKKKELEKGNIMSKRKQEEELEKNKQEENYKIINDCTCGKMGKCPKCLDKDKVKDTKHVSFDE